MKSEDRSESDVPLIDLGEMSGDTEAPSPGPPPVDAGTAGGPARRRRGRYQLLAVVGLLAVGFAAGMAVQRAAGVVPAPTPSRTPLSAPAVQKSVIVPPGAMVCGVTVIGGDNWHGTPSLKCAGIITGVHDTMITMTVDTGGSLTFALDADTVVEVDTASARLHAGQHVSVHIAGSRRGMAYADVVRVE